MSRLRSQLETIRRNADMADPALAENAHPSARGYDMRPDRGEPAVRAGPLADLDRIRDRLNRLAASVPRESGRQQQPRADRPVEGESRRGSSKLPRFAPPPMAPSLEDNRRQRPAAPEPRRQEAPAADLRAARADPRGGDLDGLRREMTQVREMLGSLVRRNDDDLLADELRRISSGIAELQERGLGSQSGQLDEIVGDMRQMRQTLSEITTQNRVFDHNALVRSIEDGYSAIATRLDNAVARHAAPEQAGSNREIAALGEHISAMRDTLEQLPTLLPLDHIDARLGDIETVLSGLGGNGEWSISRNFSALEDRLDEVSRALVAISVSPNGDPAGLERIEARLAALAQNVEDLAVPRSVGSVGDLDAVIEQIGELSGRVERVLEMADAGAGVGEGSHAILERLEALAGLVEQLHANPSSPAHGAHSLAIVEQQIGELSQRIEEAVARMPGAPGDLEHVVDAMRSFTSRLEEFEARRPFEREGSQDERFASLEEMLTQIVGRLDSVQPAQTDFSPLTSRLDDIEQQVAVSRDFAVEAATRAAERVLEMAGLMEAQKRDSHGAPDPALVERLSQEMQSLEMLARESASRNDESFAAVRRVLDAVVSRLDGFESAAPETDPRPARATHEQHSPETEEALFAAALADDRIDRQESGSHMRDRAREDEGAGAPRVEIDDVPLEPGSGVPDLAVLVRNAAERRRAHATARGGEAGQGSPDFLAAARRAARAEEHAGAERTGKERRKRAAAAGKARKGAPSGGGALSGLARYRTALMAAALIVAVAVVGLPYAVDWLSRVGSQGGAVTENPELGDQSSIGSPSGDPASGQADAGREESAADAPAASAAGAPQAADADAPTRQFTPFARPVDSDEERSASVGADGASDAATDIAAAAPDGSAMAPDAETIPEIGPEIGNGALRQAVLAGDPRALFEVARRYTDGAGVERDLAKAAQWYEYAARGGSAPAQYRLANFLEKGHGVPLDVEKSAMWYQRAAEQGNALAMHNLAVLYTSGLVGGRADMASAVGWFRKAADLGVKDSQVNLGIIYAKGLGVDADLEEAYKWLSIAAREGDADAAAKRDTLAGAMRPEQLQKARGDAELWKPAPLEPQVNASTPDPQWEPSAGRRAGTSQSSSSAQASVDPASDKAIATVQAILKRLGYDPGPADGKMGARTRDAVKAYQRKTGLPEDGEVTTELLQKLADEA